MRTLIIRSARVACVSIACTIVAPLSAQTIAITGGTVYPANGPKIDNGTVILRDGKIVAVGANLAVPSGATRIDATGKWVTPGLVNAFTTLGLSESGGPQFSGGYNDTQAQVTDGISASFEAADGVNPASTLFRPATLDGVTSVGVWPSGNWVSGRGAVMDLAGNTVGQMLVKRSAGMLLNFDAGAANAGARAAMFARLRELLVDVKQYAMRKAEYEGNRTRDFSAKSSQLDALLPVVRGTMPLFVVTERASDIRVALGIAKAFALRMVIVGGAEAWMVAGELSAARVPVMVGALNNIPESFDALGQRQENASLLRAAGVEVTLIGNGPGDPLSFNVRNVRQEAGNAVAYGMTWDDALRAITASPADVLGAGDRVGALSAGREANVVVWDGDPFEFTTRATHVYIRGVLQTGSSREDELTARYRKLPPG